MRRRSTGPAGAAMARDGRGVDEAATVGFALTGLEHARVHGPLLALADTEVTIGGAASTAFGIRAVHDDAGGSGGPAATLPSPR